MPGRCSPTRRLNLSAVLLAVAAGALVLLPACGGGGGGGGDSTSSPPSSSGNGDSGSGSGGSGSGGTGSGGSGTGGSNGSSCQPPAPVTVVGGNLFVAEQGPVRVTLLSNGGFSDYTFTFLYDYVFGIQTNNPQDKWGQDLPFRAGTTPVGTFKDEVLQPPQPDLTQGAAVPSTFPKGIPIELWLRIPDPMDGPPGPTNSSSTASIGKDLLGRDAWHTASVTYSANNTATVTFFPTASGTGFTVSLTNVFGQGTPPACTM